MLTHDDAHQGTDREIAAALSRHTGKPLAFLPFTRDQAAAETLIQILCAAKTAELRRVTSDRDQLEYEFACRDRTGEWVSRGRGATQALAICDAFLQRHLKA